MNADSGSPVSHSETKTMKKHTTSKPYISLGDLVTAISSCASNEREVLAAIQDLFRKGSVVAKTRHGRKRLKLA